MQEYLDLSRRVLTSGRTRYKPNRTGVDTVSLFGTQASYDLSEGFPLLTTRKMPLRVIAAELIWFLRGETNIQPLVRNNVHIWDRNAYDCFLKKRAEKDRPVAYSDSWRDGLAEFVDKIRTDDAFAHEHGELGEVYGAQWRHWKTRNGGEIDQIANVMKSIESNPSSRRIILTAWNPEDVPAMALPPCHAFVQFNVSNGELDCALTQRSADMFLGVPFNIASYSMLMHLVARETNLRPGVFVHSLNDAHFYCGKGKRGRFYRDNMGRNGLQLSERLAFAQGEEDYLDIVKSIEKVAPAEDETERGLDHVTAIIEQLARTPRKSPRLVLPDKSIVDLTVEDAKLFRVEGYNPFPAISREMAA